MAPEGPYRSPWAPGDWYLISTLKARDQVYVVVLNGRPATEGTEFPNLRDARDFLRDNGFQQVDRTPEGA
jgi:hypothetical protein